MIHLRLSADLTWLLVFGVAAMAFVAYEICGLTLPGWHTISWLAHHHPWIRLMITAGLLVTTGWLWVHMGHNIAR